MNFADALNWGAAPKGGGGPLPGSAALSVSEQAADDEFDRSPGNVAELTKAIAGEKRPEVRSILEGQLKTIQGGSGMFSDAMSWGNAPTPKSASIPTKQPLSVRAAAEVKGEAPWGEVALNQATALGSSIVAGWRGIAELAQGHSLKDAVDTIRGQQGSGTYEPSTPASQGVVGALASPYNPLNWPAEGGKIVGGKLADAGYPGAGAAVESVATIAPLALARGPKRAPVTIEATPVGNAVEVTANVETPAIWRNEMARRQAANEPVAAPAETQPTGRAYQPPETVSTEAPAPINGPEVPKFSQSAREVDNGLQPVDTAPPPNVGKLTLPAAQKAAEAAPEGALPASQQKARSDILRRVGLDEVRASAVQGDPKAAATDFQSSKLDNAGGNLMRSVIDREKAALVQHAENIVQETGGTFGIDEAAKMSRGNAIVAPLDSLKSYFDKAISNLYKEADQRAAGVPTKLSDFAATLSDDSLLTNSDRVHLRAGVQAYLKKLGLPEEGGLSGSVAQAETVRKYLNENWSPQNSRFVGALKDALDNDVMKAAGEDVYSAARQMRTLRARTLDDPKGIAKIMDAAGPEGINRAVPLEKIGDTITSLPVEQFNHIISTLKNDVPTPMRAQADAALAEIKSHFANRILQEGSKHQGQWAAKAVSQYLNSNAAKLKTVFTPEELAKIRDLNDAGHILAKDQSYPGAAVQEHNLMQRGAMGALRAGATGVGGALGGPLGAAAGGMIGEGLAHGASNKFGLSAAQKRIVKLR